MNITRARIWRKFFGLPILVAVMVSCGYQVSQAQLTVPIERAVVEPINIAVTDFGGTAGGEGDAGRQIADVIAADLERSGLFAPIDKRAFIQDPVSLQESPRFSDWRLINSENLITGTVENVGDDTLRVAFRLWDVNREVQLVGLAFSAPQKDWRRLAHVVSDAVYQKLTGEEGYFDTQIVYIAESGPQNRRQLRLAIMDQDGANHQFLTDGSFLVLSPRFSRANPKEITYMAYIDNEPRVYLYNLVTGQQELLGSFTGMTFSPRFSPDGNQIAFSLEQGGNSEVHIMDLRSRQSRRLTNHPAIDVSPSFSPNGQRIVFNSDRGGSQQLYVMNVDGSNVQRISFGDGRYADPVWSPRGDWIAFTRIYQGSYYIGVMKPDGSGERMLASGYDVEAPTWSPNGRVLAFYRQDRTTSQGQMRVKLQSIDFTGYNERELPTPLDGSQPAWSPLLN